MKVISFNIRCANDKDGHSVAERAPRVKALIEKYDPDLIGFQEVVPRWMEHIPADYTDTYELFHKYRDEVTDIEGCSMLWKKDKFECLDKGYFWYSETPDIPSKGWCTWGHYRMCMWAKLKNLENGTVFHFFNTHFGFGDQCHVDSVRLIREHIRHLGAKAVVLTGDFNMTQDRVGYREITKFLSDANKLTANDISVTCHGYNPDRTGIPIDFVFVTPDTMKPTYYHKMDERFDGKFPSDHYGIYCEIEPRQPVRVAAINAAVAGEEAEDTHAMRMSGIRNRVKEFSPEIAILKNCDAVLQDKMSRAYGYEGCGGIYWKKAIFELAEELEGAVVLQKCGSGKKLCVVNGGKAAEGMPVVVGVSEVPIASEEYKALRQEYTDVRRALAPKDYTPTYHAMGADMVLPLIESYVLYRGEGLHPLSYQVRELMSRGNGVADRSAVVVDFVMEI
ncbi:MAG: endonuclease/exonuclease/phosphatase family protein [Clostridia bacterium]|nr:endonuclease/exonuclease/phosphatase family protein [Clostridia bacterium]